MDVTVLEMSAHSTVRSSRQTPTLRHLGIDGHLDIRTPSRFLELDSQPPEQGAFSEDPHHFCSGSMEPIHRIYTFSTDTFHKPVRLEAA